MNGYLEAIRWALRLFPAAAAVLTAAYAGYSRRRYGSVRALRLMAANSFLLYLLCVYCLVILPLPTAQEAIALRGHEVQLVPFSFVGDMLREARQNGGQPAGGLPVTVGPALLTTLFNLLMTMPFGVYLRHYFRRGWRETLGYTFLLSLFLELTQLSGLYFLYPGSYRVFDVDDLMMNTLGGVAGYLVGGLAVRLLLSPERLDQMSLALRRRARSLLWRGKRPAPGGF